MSYQEFRPRQFQQLPVVVKNILIINIALFVASRFLFKDFQSMMPQSVPVTELGKTFEEIDCIPSRLVLFKSDLMHGNGAQEDGEKIVISFNLGITRM